MEIQSRPELAFDEQQHLYTLGGLVLPSVTQIMSPMSSMLYAAVPETKSQGLFHQIQEEVTFCGLLHEAYA